MSKANVATTILQYSALLIAVCARADTLANLAPAADTIVVGSIPERVESSSSVSFNITVERLLKGVSTPMVIHVDHAWQRRVVLPTQEPVNVSGHFRGLWFLRRAPGADWDILVAHGPDGFFPDLFWPAVEALATPYNYSPDRSLEDRLVLEVGAGAKGNPELVPDALHALNSAAVQTVLLDYLASSSARDITASLAGMLDRGQTEAIARLPRVWPAISKDERAKPDLLQALAAAFRPQDPETVRQVVALAQAASTPPDLRSALVKVLVAVHTRESLPFLAGLLTSDNPNDQWTAVFALASFANGNPAETPATAQCLAHFIPAQSAPYKTSETLQHMGFHGDRTTEAEVEILSFWRNWWTEHPELH